MKTERFITSIKNNNFDYTEWHKNLWKMKLWKNYIEWQQILKMKNIRMN